MPKGMYYDDNPALFVSRKFSNFERYWKDVLEAECTDNWEMFNGWDSYIRRRKAESRSHIQTPILYPAIEGRVSQLMARLRSREPIMRYRPADRTDPRRVLSALKIQEWVRNVLDRQGWLDEIAVMMIAAEVFPICWVKCRLGEMDMTPAESEQLAGITGMPAQVFRGMKRTVPEFEILSPSEVYHDYRVKNPRQPFIEKFHVKQLSLDEVYDRFGSDMVKRIELHESTEPQHVREWEDAAGRRSYREHGEPRYRLAEGWIWAHYEDGRVERRMVQFFPDVVDEETDATPIGKIVNDIPAPVSFDPFIPVVSRRLPFQLLGKSTVALGKPYQREAAELTNMAIDILGYSAAPPIIMEKGQVDNPHQLEFSSRSLWMLEDGALNNPPRALHVPTPNAPFLNATQAQMEAQLAHVTAAYEGITGQPNISGGDETLGQYRQRTASGQGRLDLPLLTYAGVIAGIGERYWRYMLDFPRNILGRTPLAVRTPIGDQQLTVDDLGVDATVMVPNLTEFENEEMKKIELDRAVERTMAMPFAQMNPEMQTALIKIYWKRHLNDPADLEELMAAAGTPIDPQLGSAQGGGMPQTRFSPGTGDSERRVGAISATTAGGG